MAPREILLRQEFGQPKVKEGRRQAPTACWDRERGWSSVGGWVGNSPVGGLMRVEVSRPTAGQRAPGQEPRVGIW